MRRIFIACAAFALVVLGTSPAQATVRTVGPGVPADCSADVTASLESWLATTVVDGDTVQFPDGACYRMDGTLDLIDRHNLTFVGLGAGATIKEISAPPATPKVENQMVSVVGGSGITFQNLNFQGTNTSSTFDVNREWWPTFEINGTSSVLIDNVDAIDVWGDFVQINPDTRPVTDVMANGITVQNSSADRVGRHAISCTGCDNVTIDNNAFSDIGYHVFDIEVEASAWHADNIWFTDNTISGYQHLSMVANAGIGSYVTDVTIIGNNNNSAVLQTCESPVWVLDTAPTKDRWTVSSNTLKSLGAGVNIAGVDHVTAQNNVVNMTHGGCTEQTTAVRVANTFNDVLTGNDFQGADRLVQSGATGYSVTTACGNRLSMLGSAFDRPVAC